MAKLKRYKGRHSPAGRKYLESLKRKKKKGEPVYFKTAKKQSDIERLKAAGLSKKELRALGYKGE
jgi:hypothetical protein